MATQAELEARRDALEEVAARGELRVTMEGRSVEYRSIEELRASINRLNSQIGALANTRPVRVLRFYGSKGL